MNKLILTCLLAFSANTLAEIYTNPEDVHPILPGMKAPKMELMDVAGKTITIKKGKRTKPTVITFFRGGWCPYCNLHLSELRKAESELKEMGFDVWFISADKPELLQSSLDEPDIGYTLYSDASMKTAESFGIAFVVDAGTRIKYKLAGINLEKASGQKHHMLPAPSTFIIGTDGIIQFQYTNPDYRVRLPAKVLVAAASAYNDKLFKKLNLKK